jgi:hypothetical protein
MDKTHPENTGLCMLNDWESWVTIEPVRLNVVLTQYGLNVQHSLNYTEDRCLRIFVIVYPTNNF